MRWGMFLQYIISPFLVLVAAFERRIALAFRCGPFGNEATRAAK
jgi:hypothetical protein